MTLRGEGDRSITDNLALGSDGQLNHVLALLRNQQSKGALAQDMEPIPGVALHADPALQINGRLRSPEGHLFEIEARPDGSGAWFGLHMAFQVQDLERIGCIGFGCRTTAPQDQVIRCCLLSGTRDGFTDHFFDKHILARSEESTHMNVGEARERPDLPTKRAMARADTLPAYQGLRSLDPRSARLRGMNSSPVLPCRHDKPKRLRPTERGCSSRIVGNGSDSAVTLADRRAVRALALLKAALAAGNRVARRLDLSLRSGEHRGRTGQTAHLE